MPAGLQVFGGNYIQIDGSYSTFTLASKITASSHLKGGVFQEVILELPKSYTSPIVGFDSSRPLALISLYNPSGSNRLRLRYYGTGSSTITVTFYIFDIAPATASTFGLQVFRPDGVLAYDSTDKHMRVVDHYIGSDFRVRSDSITLPGRKLIPAATIDSLWAESYETPGGWRTTYGISSSVSTGDTVTINLVTFRVRGGTNAEALSYSTLVLDVTGY